MRSLPSAEASELPRQREWQALFSALGMLLSKHGQAEPYGGGDFCLVDDDYGAHQQKVEFTSSRIDKHRVMQETQGLLAESFPKWQVIFVASDPANAPSAYFVNAQGVQLAGHADNDA